MMPTSRHDPVQLASLMGDPVLAQPRNPPKRTHPRRLRRLALVFGGLFTLGVAAFALLPYWLPTSLLRAQIVDALQKSLGCPLRIGAVSIGWGSGVVIDRLQIFQHKDASELIAELRQVRADFSPIRLIFGRGIERLELIEPVLQVRIDSRGRLNRGNLAMDGPPPARQIDVRNARCVIEDERAGTRAELAFGDVSLSLDPSGGHANVRIDGNLIRDLRASPESSSPGRFDSSASLNIPTLAARSPNDNAAAKDSRLSGEGRLRLNDIDLSTLPIRMLPALKECSLSGR